MGITEVKRFSPKAEGVWMEESTDGGYVNIADSTQRKGSK